MSTRIEFAPEVAGDFDGIVDHLVLHQVADAASRIQGHRGGHRRLAAQPADRPAGQANRELVIGRRSRGSVALYRYIARIDTVFVLAVRSQSEAGYAGRQVGSVCSRGQRPNNGAGPPHFNLLHRPDVTAA